ncbi:MAG TPA: M23 family peptidase, partial [Candidatus Kapabacteria bacterium]|nr:M23 family peptidase [Candidatus Kapabacteria bacterium]
MFSVLLIVVIALILWVMTTQHQEQVTLTTTMTSHADTTSTSSPVSKSMSSSRDSAGKSDLPQRPATAPAKSSQATTGLIIPVLGVTADQLVDTYTEARSNGRVHDAIDIMAPHNSPVIAATAGRVIRLFNSKLGGTTAYELGPDGHTVY